MSLPHSRGYRFEGDWSHALLFTSIEVQGSRAPMILMLQNEDNALCSQVRPWWHGSSARGCVVPPRHTLPVCPLTPRGPTERTSLLPGNTWRPLSSFMIVPRCFSRVPPGGDRSADNVFNLWAKKLATASDEPSPRRLNITHARKTEQCLPLWEFFRVHLNRTPGMPPTQEDRHQDKPKIRPAYVAVGFNVSTHEDHIVTAAGIPLNLSELIEPAICHIGYCFGVCRAVDRRPSTSPPARYQMANARSGPVAPTSPLGPRFFNLLKLNDTILYPVGLPKSYYPASHGLGYVWPSGALVLSVSSMLSILCLCMALRRDSPHLLSFARPSACRAPPPVKVAVRYNRRKRSWCAPLRGTIRLSHRSRVMHASGTFRRSRSANSTRWAVAPLVRRDAQFCDVIQDHSRVCSRFGKPIPRARRIRPRGIPGCNKWVFRVMVSLVVACLVSKCWLGPRLAGLPSGPDPPGLVAPPASARMKLI